MHHYFRIESLVAVVAQVEFVVAQQRIAGDEVMRTRTQVLLETRKKNFGGLDASADHRAAFENQHTIACLGEVRGADEAVVSSACHYVVEDLRPHGCCCPLRLRSSRRCCEAEG